MTPWFALTNIQEKSFCEDVTLVRGFGSFSAWFLGCVVSGLEWSIMVKGCGGPDLLTYGFYEVKSRRGKREGGRGREVGEAGLLGSSFLFCPSLWVGASHIQDRSSSHSAPPGDDLTDLPESVLCKSLRHCSVPSG